MTLTVTEPAIQRRLIQIPANIEIQKADALRELSRVTRTPQQVFVREAIDFILQKYEKALR